MSRNLRLLFVAATALCIAGASTVYACDSAKKEASAASVEGTASGCKGATMQQASTGGCTAAAKTGCASKTMADCTHCAFINDLRANAGKVTFTWTDSKEGVQFVFAAVSKEDVEAAQLMGGKAYALMTPSHCEMAKAAMAEKSCESCKEGLAAFAGMEIVFKNTKNGAVATVKTADKTKIEQLHTFAKGLVPVEEKPQG